MKSKKGKILPAKRNMDFSEFIDHLIRKYENKPGSMIQINSLSSESSIEKRRLYDLLNVLVACDICDKTDSHNYIWKSINNKINAVEQISYDLENKAIHHYTVEDIFILPDSPSIGLITTRFIGVFLYLNINSLNIRDAALAMATDETHFKPILRRLYLVAYLLERIGLFKHSQKIGEYQLDFDIQATCIKSLEDLARNQIIPADSIEYQLNRFDEHYLQTKFKSRRENFIGHLRKRKAEQTTENDPSKLAMKNYQGVFI